MNPDQTTTPDQTAMTESLRDIRPILNISDSWPWWVWLLLALALVLTMAGLWILWKRRSNKQKVAPTPTIVEPTPYEWFLKAMQSIDALRPQPVAYCFKLSFIFREYLERCYQFPATDRTSEEILRDLRRLYLFNDAEAAEIRKLFNLIDPVKYAAVVPANDDVQWAEQMVRRLAEQHRYQGANHAPSAL